MAALLALTLLPGVRHFAYETFLYVHRALAITIMASLWTHVTNPGSFVRLLLVITLFALAATTILRSALQIFRNSRFRDWSIHITKIIGITQTGEMIILRVQLARPRAIRPGDYFHVTILTWRLGFAFQRHPLTVAWWDAPEDGRDPNVLYFVVEPRRGWTKSLQRHYTRVMSNVSPRTALHTPQRDDHPADLEYKCRQRIWLDGAFGNTPNWKDFDTFLLFASKGGVFAQLSWVKFLTEKSKTDPYVIRKVVLAWQAEEPHFTLAQWIQSILEDPQVRRDVSPSTPTSSIRNAQKRIDT